MYRDDYLVRLEWPGQCITAANDLADELERAPIGANVIVLTDAEPVPHFLKHYIPQWRDAGCAEDCGSEDYRQAWQRVIDVAKKRRLGTIEPLVVPIPTHKEEIVAEQLSASAKEHATKAALKMRAVSLLLQERERAQGYE